MQRANHATGNPYEARFGYSRAVRRGAHILVSGTTSVNPSSGAVRYPESALLQAQAAFAEIIAAIEALGGRREDVVRVRMFVLSRYWVGDGAVFRRVRATVQSHGRRPVRTTPRVCLASHCRACYQSYGRCLGVVAQP